MSVWWSHTSPRISLLKRAGSALVSALESGSEPVTGSQLAESALSLFGSLGTDALWSLQHLSPYLERCGSLENPHHTPRLVDHIWAGHIAGTQQVFVKGLNGTELELGNALCHRHALHFVFC